MKSRLADFSFSALTIGAAALLTLAALVIWLPSAGNSALVRGGDAGPRDDPFARFETDIATLAQPVADRPVFQPSRRPPVIEVVEEAPPPEVTLTLVGVLDSEISKIALFRMSNSEEIFRLREGQVIGDFRIRAIGDAGVTLMGTNGEEVLMKLGS